MLVGGAAGQDIIGLIGDCTTIVVKSRSHEAWLGGHVHAGWDEGAFKCTRCCSEY